jgi:predicted dehydrogenase
VDRRQFLASPAALAAAPASRLRIAFLGAAHSHAFEKSKVVRENKDFELAGIWDEDPAVRAQFEQAGVKLLSRDAILGDSSIEVVAVESEVKRHAALARLALEAGKHVHLEKPPSAELDSFRSLSALAERKRLRLQMGYMWRHHPGINAALEAARSGWLGDVFLVRAAINTYIAPGRRQEFAPFRGGQMFELGCHLIDPMVRLLGRPRAVTPFLRTHGESKDALADNTVAVFDYPRALGIVSSSALQPGANRHRAFEIFGSNGSAVVRPLEPPLIEIYLEKAAGPYIAGPQRPGLRPFRRYVEDFGELAESIRAGRPLATSPREDLMVHEALLMASGMR